MTKLTLSARGRRTTFYLRIVWLARPAVLWAGFAASCDRLAGAGETRVVSDVFRRLPTTIAIVARSAEPRRVRVLFTDGSDRPLLEMHCHSGSGGRPVCCTSAAPR